MADTPNPVNRLYDICVETSEEEMVRDEREMERVG